MAYRDFHAIKSDYISATPFIGYAQPFKLSNENSCVLVTIGYTIRDHYYEHFLHNMTTGDWIRDPDSYYKKSAARRVGGQKINEMEKGKSVLQAEQKALSAIADILENGTNTGTGEYVPPKYLE